MVFGFDDAVCGGAFAGNIAVVEDISLGLRMKFFQHVISGRPVNSIDGRKRRKNLSLYRECSSFLTDRRSRLFRFP